jgi:uncharacterized protein YndB with AHSA1/START domain
MWARCGRGCRGNEVWRFGNLKEARMMKLKKITYLMDLSAPVEKVFALLSEPEQIQKWMIGLVGVEYLDDRDVENPVGVRFKQRIKEGGKVQEYEGEVTEYQKPCLLGVRVGNRMFTVHTVYRLTPIPTGTRLVYECEMTFHTGVAKVMGRLFGWFSKLLVRKLMKSLKQVAEG